MKMYCPKCGSGSSFNMTKPKFCQECGESFSGTASKQPIKKRKTIAKKIEQVAPEVEKKETILAKDLSKKNKILRLISF